MDGVLPDAIDDVLLEAIDGTLSVGVGGKGFAPSSSRSFLDFLFRRGDCGAAISMPLREEDEELLRRKTGRTFGERRDMLTK